MTFYPMRSLFFLILILGPAQLILEASGFLSASSEAGYRSEIRIIICDIPPPSFLDLI